VLTAVAGVGLFQAIPASAETAPTAPLITELVVTGRDAVHVEYQDRSTNETGFQIESRVPGGSWRVVSNTRDHSGGQPGATGKVYGENFTGLPQPVENCYRARAFNAAGGRYSTVRCAAPKAPADFRYTAKTATSVTLTWRDAAWNERFTDLAVGYASDHELTIVRHWGPFPDVNTVTTYTVTGLRPNIAYEFSLTATNDVGSAAAPRVVARTPAS
jgi:hypothetical protein